MRFGPLVLVLAIPPSVSAFEEYCDSLGEGPDFMLEGYLYGACASCTVPAIMGVTR